MAEVTFRKTQTGKLDGKPFPKVGDTVEVSDVMVPALRSLGFVEDETAAPEPETADARETREVNPDETRDGNEPDPDSEPDNTKRGNAGKSED